MSVLRHIYFCLVGGLVPTFFLAFLIATLVASAAHAERSRGTPDAVGVLRDRSVVQPPRPISRRVIGRVHGRLLAVTVEPGVRIVDGFVVAPATARHHHHGHRR